MSNRTQFSLGALVAVAAAANCPMAAAARELQISQTANESDLSVSVHPRFHAGAIDSLVFRGVQYVNNYDHGRQIQTAIQLDGLGECLNPTEAGSKADARKQSTSSIALVASDEGNVLRTITQAAFWLLPAEPYHGACGLFRSEDRAQNATVLSSYVIGRTTRFYDRTIRNLIVSQVSVTFPEARKSAVIEGVTGYLPSQFNTFYSYDPRSHRLKQISAGTKEQWVTTSIIVATQDARSAMGILSPQIWNGDPRRDFYSYFYFPDGDATSKWSCRFGESAIKAGASFDYSIAIAVGSLKEVRTALDAYVNSEGLLASKLP